jgi:hypothetical protein
MSALRARVEEGCRMPELIQDRRASPDCSRVSKEIIEGHVLDHYW